MEFLKANGIEDHSFVKEMDYQEVLNSQEIFGDELAMFAKKELQKEVRRFFLNICPLKGYFKLSKNIAFPESSKLMNNDISRWWFQRPREKSWEW